MVFIFGYQRRGKVIQAAQYRLRNEAPKIAHQHIPVASGHQDDHEAAHQDKSGEYFYGEFRPHPINLKRQRLFFDFHRSMQN